MRKLLIGLATIVVLVVVLAIVLPFVIPVDSYKGQLISRVKAATGRDLKIAGPVRLSILPSLEIEANQVSFSNPPGASSPDMLQLAKLQVGLKLFPLLSGELAVDRFILVDPVIDLEIDKQGRPNWSFAQAGSATPAQPAPTAGAPPAAAPAGKGGMSLSEIRLDDIRLVNGLVTYVDQRTGHKESLTDIGMKLSLPSLETALTAEGSVSWHTKPIKMTLRVAQPGALLGGGTSDVALKIASEPVNVDYQGKVTNATPAKLDGAIDLSVPSVRALAAWAGNPIQTTGNTLGPLAIKGNLAVVGSKISFNDAQLGLDQIKANGAFAFDGGGAKPYLQGKLDIDRLDVNPYLDAESTPAAGAPKPAGQPAPAPTPPAAAGWSDAPIDLSGLRTANADFALSVGSLQIRKIQIGKSALGVQLKDGRMTADLSQLALYQGNGNGKLMVDGSGAVPDIDATFKLAKLQVEPLLRDAAGFDRLTGTGDFDVAVSGRGRSERELIGALNGKGALSFVNGVIKGFNLGAMVRNVEAAFKGGGASGSADQTEFSQLTGTFVITNGILKNSDLDLKGPALHATGAGTVDLPKRTVDYRLTPSVDAQVGKTDLANVSVPVIIQGSWDNLSYHPDLQSALTQGAGQKLIEGLTGGNKPGAKPGAIPGDVLKGLFGGRK